MALLKLKSTGRSPETMIRSAFLHIFEPQPPKDGKGDPAYNGRFIFHPNHPQVELIEQTIIDVAKAKWPGETKAGKPKYEAVLEKCRADGEICFSREEYCNRDGEVYDGFEGMFHLGARNTTQPGIFDADKTKLTAGPRPYSGSYVCVNVDIWAQDNEHGRGIRASLSGVQFYRDGDAFAGGAPSSADDFDDVADTGEEPDEDDDDL